MDYTEEIEKHKAKIRSLRKLQRQDLIDKSKDLIESFVGKVFKTEHYFDEDASYFEYFEIIGVENTSIEIEKDQTNFYTFCKAFSKSTETNQIIFDLNKQIWTAHLGYEISKEEFDNAKLAILEELKSL